MCGLLAHAGRVALASTFDSSLAGLAHRGPDDQGEWQSPDGSVRLGHRRLAIVDLSSLGRQPMANEDETIHLVGNGEIYNAPRLRRELEAKGHRFRSGSDNEVILHAYESWGEAFLDRLEGMFALVLWDERRHRLLAARDRLGIKPLYYAVEEGGIRLASESGVLRGSGGVDPLALCYLLTLGYLPAPCAMWRGVAKLAAGEMLTWEAATGVRVRRWWEPPRQVSGEGDDSWPERFEAVLQDHLLADVPVGLFLSAGLDSSSVAVGLRQLGVTTGAFTVGFPGSVGEDEAPLAGELCTRLGFDHRVVALTPEQIWPLIEGWPALADEPLTTSGYLSLWTISQAAAASGMKVVLAGDGGDELLGGYRWYQGAEAAFPWWGGRWRRELGRGLGMMAPARWRCWAAASLARSSLWHRHAWRVFPRLLPEEVVALLAPLGVDFDDERWLAPLRCHYEPGLPVRRALQRVDLMTYCAEYNLTKVDRASMACSLEVRVPFLDRRLVEWALTRPVMARELQESKPWLRDYLALRAPGMPLSLRKQGFSLRGNEGFDWQRAMRRIAQGPWVRQGYWDSRWANLVAPGVPYREGRIWMLLMVSVWAEGRSL